MYAKLKRVHTYIILITFSPICCEISQACFENRFSINYFQLKIYYQIYFLKLIKIISYFHFTPKIYFKERFLDRLLNFDLNAIVLDLFYPTVLNVITKTKFLNLRLIVSKTNSKGFLRLKFIWVIVFKFNTTCHIIKISKEIKEVF